MGKRKSEYQLSHTEIKRSAQQHYDGWVKQPSKIKPIWLQDNYGVKMEVVDETSSKV